MSRAKFHPYGRFLSMEELGSPPVAPDYCPPNMEAKAGLRNNPVPGHRGILYRDDSVTMSWISRSSQRQDTLFRSRWNAFSRSWRRYANAMKSAIRSTKPPRFRLVIGRPEDLSAVHFSPDCFIQTYVFANTSIAIRQAGCLGTMRTILISGAHQSGRGQTSRACLTSSDKCTHGPDFIIGI